MSKIWFPGNPFGAGETAKAAAVPSNGLTGMRFSRAERRSWRRRRVARAMRAATMLRGE